MSFEIEFGTKSGADAARDEHGQYVCPVDDDRRLKTVAFVDDTPDHVRDQLEAGAQTGRAEREEGAGQAELTDGEKNRVGPFVEENNYLKATSVKALFRENGVSDWEAWYDPELTVDEHKSSVLPQAQQAGGGDRIENEGPDRDAAARAEQAANEQCDHARDHCKHGEPGACEFLKEACGYDEAEVDRILSDRSGGPTESEQSRLVTIGGGDYPEMEVSPEVAGALSRSWQGYRGAVSRLDDELSDAREAVINAQRAMAAINRIREQHGQDELHPDRLHDLLDSLEEMPESIPEVRTLDHFANRGGENAATDDTAPYPAEATTDLDAVQDSVASDIVDAEKRGRRNLAVSSLSYALDHQLTPRDAREAILSANWVLGKGNRYDPEALLSDAAEAASHPDQEDVIEMDDQRDLSGERADPQARLAGGETGEIESAVEEHVEENEGGLMADERQSTTHSTGDAEQQIPDEFQVAEGGQETL